HRLHQHVTQDRMHRFLPVSVSNVASVDAAITAGIAQDQSPQLPATATMLSPTARPARGTTGATGRSPERQPAGDGPARPFSAARTAAGAPPRPAVFPHPD